MSIFFAVTFAEYSLVGWPCTTCILLAGEICPLFGQQKYMIGLAYVKLA